MSNQFNKKPFRGLNALVVEDVAAMRELLSELLRDLGFEDVVRCEDGAVALRTLEDTVHPIDIIVCDLEMPMINGIEFIQMLRKSPNRTINSIPIVIVTGHSERKNLLQAVRAGVHGFLVKPVSLAALEKRIHRALKGAPIDPEVFERETQRKTDPPVKIIEG